MHLQKVQSEGSLRMEDLINSNWDWIFFLSASEMMEPVISRDIRLNESALELCSTMHLGITLNDEALTRQTDKRLY